MRNKKKYGANQSYKFWSGDRQAESRSEDQLPDCGKNPELRARSQPHWKQTHSRNPLPAQKTESGNPPLQSQTLSISMCHVVVLNASCNLVCNLTSIKTSAHMLLWQVI